MHQIIHDHGVDLGHLFYFLIHGDTLPYLWHEIVPRSLAEKNRTMPDLTSHGQPPDPAFEAGKTMLANRLRKNLRNIGKWAARQQLECFRLYDADMPEFAFAIDCYGARIHVQEYRAPGTVAEEKVDLHRRQALAAIAEVLGIPDDRIFMKLRERQRGAEQYRPLEGGAREFVVHEGAAKFWVNLQGYLDTGLFLDHRPIRRFIHDHAAGKRFLNLFCYTATATVHAALGNASSSLSVDLSNTYLDWARRNFILNGLNSTAHKLIQKDCIRYLEHSRDRFDLIFLDPPTFSNSKRTDNVLDIQRDHATLIGNAMRLLEPGGLLIFSTNRRRFRLDDSLAKRFMLEDYSARSFDRDFERSQDMHQVWLIRHR